MRKDRRSDVQQRKHLSSPSRCGAPSPATIACVSVARYVVEPALLPALMSPSLRAAQPSVAVLECPYPGRSVFYPEYPFCEVDFRFRYRVLQLQLSNISGPESRTVYVSVAGNICARLEFVSACDNSEVKVESSVTLGRVEGCDEVICDIFTWIRVTWLSRRMASQVRGVWK